MNYAVVIADLNEDPQNVKLQDASVAAKKKLDASTAAVTSVAVDATLDNDEFKVKSLAFFSIFF